MSQRDFAPDWELVSSQDEFELSAEDAGAWNSIVADIEKLSEDDANATEGEE